MGNAALFIKTGSACAVDAGHITKRMLSVCVFSIFVFLMFGLCLHTSIAMELLAPSINQIWYDASFICSMHLRGLKPTWGNRNVFPPN